MNHSNPKPGIFLASLCGLALATQLGAQNTAFTYQGRLNDNGVPANGVYDFTFAVFDAPSAGTSLAVTIVEAVGVTNGLFTALVDLTSSPFTGPARWLEISVSTNDADSFTALVPRQALTPSPYAIFANTAGTVTNGAIATAQLAANSVATGNIQDNAVTAGKIASGQVVKSLNGLTDGVSLTPGANVTITPNGNTLTIASPSGGIGPWQLNGTNTFYSGGNVGIGTTNPRDRLDVRANRAGIRIQGTATGIANLTWVDFADGSGTDIGYVGDASTTDRAIYLGAYNGDVVLHTSAGRALTAIPNGNVGIGTATPLAKLEVRGDIRLGPSGEFRATSGEENLRIVRGTVAANGSRIRGSGFTSSRSGAGDYLITFTPPFADVPTATANLEKPSIETIAGTVVVDNPSAGSVSFVVRYYENDSALAINAEFHFIAIGPR